MNLNDRQLQLLLEDAIEAATQAGVYIQSQVGGSFKQSKKKDGSTLASQVVTEIDVSAQQLIIDCLKPSLSRYNLGLLAEETVDDESRFTKAYFWCIDPMDGTLAFTEQRTGYAVSIALVNRDGEPVIGVVYVPDLEDCYAVRKGKEVFLNGQSFFSAPAIEPSGLNAYFDHSFAYESYKTKVLESLMQRSEDEFGAPLHHRVGFGAVRNALAAITAPHGLYFKFPKAKEGGGSIWDFAATQLLAEALGHHVSDAAGEPLLLNRPDTTFMNRQGVIFTTDRSLVPFVRKMYQALPAAHGDKR